MNLALFLLWGYDDKDNASIVVWCHCLDLCQSSYFNHCLRVKVKNVTPWKRQYLSNFLENNSCCRPPKVSQHPLRCDNHTSKPLISGDWYHSGNTAELIGTVYLSRASDGQAAIRMEQILAMWKSDLLNRRWVAHGTNKSLESQACKLGRIKRRLNVQNLVQHLTSRHLRRRHGARCSCYWHARCVLYLTLQPWSR